MFLRVKAGVNALFLYIRAFLSCRTCVFWVIVAVFGQINAFPSVTFGLVDKSQLKTYIHLFALMDMADETRIVVDKNIHKEVKKYAVDREILLKDAAEKLLRIGLDSEGWEIP